MKTDSSICISGHRGLVGSAISRCLKSQGHTKSVGRTHAELDLLDERTTAEFFALEEPEYDFLAVAKVGGIHANNIYPAEFIRSNPYVTPRKLLDVSLLASSGWRASTSLTVGLAKAYADFLTTRHA